jgi:hypothetical protein
MVFSTILKFDTSGVPYPAFVYAGLLAWNFLYGAISAAAASVGDQMAVVSKVAFPRIVLAERAKVPPPNCWRASPSPMKVVLTPKAESPPSSNWAQGFIPSFRAAKTFCSTPT